MCYQHTHTPKEGKRMKKAFIIIILCMILQIFTVTVYANDSNVNIVSADNYDHGNLINGSALSIIFHLMYLPKRKL